MQCFNILLHTIFIMIFTGHRKIIFHIEILQKIEKNRNSNISQQKKYGLGRHKIYII